MTKLTLPRSAPKSRFERFEQIETRVMAHTLAQVERWTETDLNWHMRKALEVQGHRTFHIREASETGIADLIVYRTWAQVDGRIYHPQADKPFGGKWGDQPSNPTQLVEAWLELKIDNDRGDKNVRPSQKQFMRAHWYEGRNALFVMFDRKVGMLAVHQGDLKGRVKMYPPSPYATRWQEVFNHFKVRRASVLAPN